MKGKTFDDFVQDDNYAIAIVGCVHPTESTPRKTYIRCIPSTEGVKNGAEEYIIYAKAEEYDKLTQYLPPKFTGIIGSFGYKGPRLSVIYLDTYYIGKP